MVGTSYLFLTQYPNMPFSRFENSKYSVYNAEIDKLYSEGKNKTLIAEILISSHNLTEDKETVRNYVRSYLKHSQQVSVPQQPEKTDQQLVLADINKVRENSKVKELERKYAYLLGQFEESEKRFETLIGIKEQISISVIEPVFAKDKHEAVPIIQLSDWHFEERVDSHTINGLNEYNLDIAAFRWDKCIQNSMKLVHKERQSSDIGQLVLWLGGDFITGYIHEELEESNYLSPIQAIMFAKDKIISAIKFYLDNGKFRKITIPCNFGNHGRTHKKPRFSTGYKNSYEWMLFKEIESYFSSEKRVEFVIPNGLFAYIEVMGKVCRFWHGDSIKYGGGIGGLTIPLIKAIHKYDEQTEAHYNFMGHYHSLQQATRNCIVNGSGIGFNAYAQRIGASPEEPMQGFNLIDSKYGLTVKMPIFCK